MAMLVPKDISIFLSLIEVETEHFSWQLQLYLVRRNYMQLSTQPVGRGFIPVGLRSAARHSLLWCFTPSSQELVSHLTPPCLISYILSFKLDMEIVLGQVAHIIFLPLLLWSLLLSVPVLSSTGLLSLSMMKLGMPSSQSFPILFIFRLLHSS